MSNTEPIVSFANVNFAYLDSFNVLENINFSIPSGDFACIVGPNGGGKTTLIKLILGLLKPNTGVIKVFDSEPGKKQSRIGYVPQFSKFDSNFPVSVRDVVLMGCLERAFFWGSYSKTQVEKAYEVIEQVGLKDFKDKIFSDLSGGQKQRALIARALISDPQLLLLDEPTASVDAQGTEKFYDMFENLNNKMAIIMVSHDVGFVTRKVKSVICVHKTLQIHPVSQLTGETMIDIYGSEVHVIRHDHRCSEKGHTCPHS